MIKTAETPREATIDVIASTRGPEVLLPVVERPDRFLWKLCPFLQTRDLEFMPLSSDDYTFYEEPFAQLKKLKSNLYFLENGAFHLPKNIFSPLR